MKDYFIRFSLGKHYAQTTVFDFAMKYGLEKAGNEYTNWVLVSAESFEDAKKQAAIRLNLIPRSPRRETDDD